ncbi:hypothetical protein ACH0BF_24620 [Pseudobacillus sp. 179-B 2D1 NHS]|uniref:hypothetical protein n=1 Tax=Pseudobacillus sp. 179-B 2D1 NHS TaxID=3374292 RepID=UPI00387A7D69
MGYLPIVLPNGHGIPYFHSVTIRQDGRQPTDGCRSITSARRARERKAKSE